MQITLPPTLDGSPGVSSVLDLDPLLRAARGCRPDAIRLLPPPGPDDLPNGAALCVIRERLAAAELGATGGIWRVEPEADPQDPSWRAGTVFEGRALLAALSEAGVEPLILDWRPPLTKPDQRDALAELLQHLLEEAERGGVRIALRSRLMGADEDRLLRDLDSPQLGVCLDVHGEHGVETAVRRLGSKLFAAVARLEPICRQPALTAAHLRALRDGGFAGPLHLEGGGDPSTLAYAVGWVRGVLTP